MGDDEKGTKFTLGCNGHEIIGFHGSAQDNLNALGAYITTLTLTKLEYIGEGSDIWDDGTFEGVKKVSFYHNDGIVRCIEFDYVKDGKIETRVQGGTGDFTKEEVIIPTTLNIGRRHMFLSIYMRVCVLEHCLYVKSHFVAVYSGLSK